MAANTAHPERRWVCPGGAIVVLAYGTHTTGNRDGWSLTVKHPRTHIVISRTHLGRTVPEAELAAALAAVGAVPVLPTTRTTRRNPR